MRLPKFGAGQLLIMDIWQNTSSCAEAAAALEVPTATLKWQIWILRRRGYRLKRYEVGTGRELPGAARPATA